MWLTQCGLRDPRHFYYLNEIVFKYFFILLMEINNILFEISYYIFKAVLLAN